MHVTVLGDRQISLPPEWTNETFVTLVGDVRIDAATPALDATVTCVALVGDAVIEVPPGSKVTGGGFSLVGDRKIHALRGRQGHREPRRLRTRKHRSVEP